MLSQVGNGHVRAIQIMSREPIYPAHTVTYVAAPADNPYSFFHSLGALNYILRDKSCDYALPA